jgi:hypothetical protein
VAAKGAWRWFLMALGGKAGKLFELLLLAGARRVTFALRSVWKVAAVAAAVVIVATNMG